MYVVKKALHAYVFCAVTALSSVILFIVANLLALPFLTGAPQNSANCVFQKYGADTVLRAYPGVDRQHVEQLLSEFCTLGPLHYEPFSESRERVFSGRYVNVDEAGFRQIKEQCSWPPSTDTEDVFVFGGSTTFGYGVADGETIPSFLQEVMRESSPRKTCVYNFGRGYYYSTLERIMFEQLLLKGLRPSRAVFIDGLNEFYYSSDVGPFSSEFAKLANGTIYSEYRNTYLRHFLNRHLPVIRFWTQMLGKESVIIDPHPEYTAIDDRDIDKMVDRYLFNRQSIHLIGEHLKIPLLFVMQPIPTHAYDLSLSPFVRNSPEKSFGRHWTTNRAYPRLLRSVGDQSHILNLAEMQLNSRELHYVDIAHYNPKMNHAIATAIAHHL